VRPVRRLVALAVAFGLLGFGPAAAADSYPSRPVRWIVPYPAGGTTDILARIMGQFLSDRFGQPVVIENRPGGGTNIAAQAVINSPPDGYTLLLAATTNAVNATLYEALPFNFMRDIAPVAGFTTLPLVIVATPSFAPRTIPEFIAYAKANPGKVNMASFGTATISHLAIELLKLSSGLDLVHVPYRGGAPMVTDLLGGLIQVGVDALPNSLPHIERGALNALAVTTGQRSPRLPNVPSVAETVAGYDVGGWLGVGVPAGTPPEAIARLADGIRAGLADPGVKARMAELGATAMPMGPAEFGAFVAAETGKWAKVIKAANIKVQ
jgi:tripartite-type tricarboxylate transporter receptor subunit TctC